MRKSVKNFEITTPKPTDPALKFGFPPLVTLLHNGQVLFDLDGSWESMIALDMLTSLRVRFFHMGPETRYYDLSTDTWEVEE